MPTSAVRRRRWTRADFDRVVDAGGFGPEDRIELLDGELWEVTPQGSLHATACGLVMQVLQKAFGQGSYVRVQFPVALDDVSEPEPDIAVVAGKPRDHAAEHPRTALLVVEISESSLSFDRGRKLTAYARNEIPEYWIVDLKSSRVEIHRDPAGPRYASKTILSPGETVTPLHAPDAMIAIADLLP